VGGVGIDPALSGFGHSNLEVPQSVRLIAGQFPEDLPEDGPFDVITMLAVLEHLPPPIREGMGGECSRRLRAGGRLILTVPTTRADALVHALKRMRLLDGIALDEHTGFDPNDTASIFQGAGFRLLAFRRFQLGFNRLFVFQKLPSA
jgi:protein-L-isoaspartate O-methyltransferase